MIFTVARNTVLLLKRQKGYAEGKTRRRRLKDVMFAVCLQVSWVHRAGSGGCKWRENCSISNSTLKTWFLKTVRVNRVWWWWSASVQSFRVVVHVRGHRNAVIFSPVGSWDPVCFPKLAQVFWLVNHEKIEFCWKKKKKISLFDMYYSLR